jgi:hypothetical protein
MKRVLGIAAAVLLAAGSALLLLRDDSPSSAPAVNALASPLLDSVLAPIEPSSAARDRLSVEIAASTAVTSEPPTADLAQAMAQRAYENFGPRLVGYLVRQGLSRVDAEPIVAELLDKIVTCTLAALREQALEQRVDFEQVLSALDAELYDTDGPLITAILDVGAMSRRAMPCSMTALAQAGIPPQAASDLLPRQPR